MSYKAEISRSNPTSFIILIDQSASMREPLDSSGTTKADAVASAVNSLIASILTKCTKSDGIRDYFHVGVIGYGGYGVGPTFSGFLNKNELIPISTVGNYPLRVEKREKIVIGRDGKETKRNVNFPIWIEAKAAGVTPMCEALDLASSYLRKWLNHHPDCLPPIVFNISDGESSDGNPYRAAEELMGLKSKDGNTLLFNLFVSGISTQSIEYPSSEKELDDEYAKLLFAISSPLTNYMSNILSADGYKIKPNAKGFVFNADFDAIIRFLDIGTRPSKLN